MAAASRGVAVGTAWIPNAWAGVLEGPAEMRDAADRLSACIAADGTGDAP